MLDNVAKYMYNIINLLYTVCQRNIEYIQLLMTGVAGRVYYIRCSEKKNLNILTDHNY